MAYTAITERAFRENAGSLSKKISSEFTLVDAEFAAHGVLIEAAAGGAGSALASTKFIVGNGSGVATPVNMSGDATLANTGAVTIAAGAVDEAKLTSYAADGLHAKRIARATYDFADKGGTVGNIGLGVSLPVNAVIVRSWYTVLTTFTSADGSATVAISISTDDVAGIVAATAINADGTIWAAGHHEGIQTGTAENFSEQTTAARELMLTIGVQKLTAGKLILFCEYVVLE